MSLRPKLAENKVESLVMSSLSLRPELVVFDVENMMSLMQALVVYKLGFVVMTRVGR
jgi:hypothetical protein